MNPRLEACVEEYLAETYNSNSMEISASVDALAAIDTTLLPKKLASSLKDAANAAASVLPILANIEDAQLKLDEATVTYESLHQQVREIEREVRKREAAMKRLKSQRQTTDDPEEQANVDNKMVKVSAEIESFNSQIPSEWSDSSKTYQSHLKTLLTAQRKYRRAMDDSFSGVFEAARIIKSGPQFEAFKPVLLSLQTDVASMDSAAASEAIKAAETGLREIPGANSIKSLMSKSRRAYKKNKADKGAELLQKASVQLDSEISWRVDAMTNTLPALLAFQDETKYSIGLRSQDRLPDFLVPRISKCKAAHRNIALQF